MTDNIPRYQGYPPKSDDDFEELYESGRASYVYDPATGRTTIQRIVQRTNVPFPKRDGSSS